MVIASKNQLHPVKWDKKKIETFWNHLSLDNTLQDLYFSKQRGKGLIKYIQKYIVFKGHVIDIGCGPGYLMDHLINNGIACSGADISKDTINKLNSRLANNKLFIKAKVSTELTQVPFSSQSTNSIFFLETIEHLLKDDIIKCLKNIYEVLKKDGYLIVTTPYNENLKTSMVICPECECTFHNMQHIGSFNTVSLRNLLESNGFLTISCKPVILLPEWGIYFNSLKSIYANYLFYCPDCTYSFQCRISFFRSILKKINISSIFHLVYIGKKIPTK